MSCFNTSPLTNSFNMMISKMTKYFSPAWTIFGLLIVLSLPTTASAAQHQAQFADIDYDVVYVRCSRGKEPVLRPRPGVPDSC